MLTFSGGLSNLILAKYSTPKVTVARNYGSYRKFAFCVNNNNNNKNSSGDEIANVLVNDDIAHT